MGPGRAPGTVWGNMGGTGDGTHDLTLAMQVLLATEPFHTTDYQPDILVIKDKLSLMETSSILEFFRGRAEMETLPPWA